MLVPDLSPVDQSLTRRRPVTTTRSVLWIDTAQLVASCRNIVIEYQLVSASIHFCWPRSNLRWLEASRKLVIASPSLVVIERGSDATIPVSVMLSDKVFSLDLSPAPGGCRAGDGAATTLVPGLQPRLRRKPSLEEGGQEKRRSSPSAETTGALPAVEEWSPGRCRLVLLEFRPV